jgi:hypothetical protein
MSIIKSITINENVVTITTNSNVIKQYTFPNNFKAIQYYIDITM